MVVQSITIPSSIVFFITHLGILTINKNYVKIIFISYTKNRTENIK